MALTSKSTDLTPKIVTLLGGQRAFKRKPKTQKQLQDVLRKGLSFGSFDALRVTLDVPAERLAEVVGVAPRTLTRRKASQQLTSIESDRLYRVAYVTLTAAETLGTIEKAREWLHAPNRALGGGSPMSLLDTEIGEQQVEELLQRIEYGVFS